MQKLRLVALCVGVLLSACSSFLPLVVPTQPPVVETPTTTIEFSPRSSETPTVTPTLEPTPTNTVTPTSTPSSDMISVAPLAAEAQKAFTPRFLLQTGTPVGVANFIKPEAGCNWMGVGGQAFNSNDEPVTYLVVEVGGTLEGNNISQLALSGLSSALGKGGYLIDLANRPIASDGTLWIQLFDLAGQPLTEKIFFPTFAECERNFILINFREVSPQYRVILPLIFK